MMGLSWVIFMSALLAGVSCYDNNITMGELSPAISQEITNMIKQFSEIEKRDCRRFREAEVGFLLYTRNNTEIPITLDTNNPKLLEPHKKTVLLIHGWLLSANSSGITKLKDAYLRRYDCNVIVVEWAKQAWQPYTISYCYVSKTSHYIAKMLCLLSKLPHFSLNNVHIVGHSMGAQIAGVVGQYTVSKCQQQIGRITGLDPSGPLFQNIPERGRLDKSDALFVSVIHTDQMRFGYTGNIGHVDFHVNCGQSQPGCPSVSNLNDSTLVSHVACNHYRSLEYMTESIMSNKFVAVSCGMCPRSCRANMINEVYLVMGEDCRQVPRGSNKYYISTSSSPPYAKGWALYDAKLP